jgi:hypothetical protein
VTALAAGALAAGCGGDDVDSDTIAEAARATADRGGMKTEFKSITSLTGAPVAGLPISASGTEDPKRRHATYRVDMSSHAGVIPDAGDDPADFRGRLMRRGPVMYTSMPFMTKGLARDNGLEGHWFEIDLRAAPNTTSDPMAALISSSQQSPGQVFDYALAATTTERVGEEKLDGVDTTHWRGELEFDRLPQVVPKDERLSVEGGAESLAEITDSDSSPVDAWIDEQGLLRRIRVKHRFVKTPDGKKTDGTLDMDARFSAFGTRVEVKPPPADDVITIAELIRAASR